LRSATAEPPGPVHLAVTADALAASIGHDVPPVPALAAAAGDQPERQPEPVPAWPAARRPVMLLGHAALRAQAGPAVRRLADAWGCPVVVTPLAKGLLSESHPLHAGTLGMAGQALVWRLLHQADLLLAIGLDATERPTPWPSQRPSLNIGSLFHGEPAPAADLGRTLDALRSAHPGPTDWTRAEISTHRQQLREACDAGRVPGRLNLGDVIDALRAALPVDALLTVDGGAHRPLVGQCWTTRRPRQLLMGTRAAASGEALCGAIAAQVLDPLQPVVCLLGEDGLAMVQAELRMAAALKLSPTVLVLCDGRPLRAQPAAVPRVDGIDVALLAQSMGCDGLLVDSVRSLAAALGAPRASDRPLVIGAFIEPVASLDDA
jgi:acetolactate synthase-1/2/3 large subunit